MSRLPPITFLHLFWVKPFIKSRHHLVFCLEFLIPFMPFMVLSMYRPSFASKHIRGLKLSQILWRPFLKCSFLRKDFILQKFLYHRRSTFFKLWVHEQHLHSQLCHQIQTHCRSEILILQVLSHISWDESTLYVPDCVLIPGKFKPRHHVKTIASLLPQIAVSRALPYFYCSHIPSLLVYSRTFRNSGW